MAITATIEADKVLVEIKLILKINFIFEISFL
jgi:hypothetical protein